jgi:hypothetical protein
MLIYDEQVYLSAIAGHVPAEMVQCISAFMEACYIVRQNAITNTDLQRFEAELKRFHRLRNIFISTGVRKNFSLPRQHALVHYLTGIPMFGAPNGLCSSITESKHIKAVKEPWRRSSRFKALPQMLRTLTRLDKLSALRIIFAKKGMMNGTTSEYTARTCGESIDNKPFVDKVSETEDDCGPTSGPKALSVVELATTHRKIVIQHF